jgi:hypothetical protein
VMRQEGRNHAAFTVRKMFMFKYRPVVQLTSLLKMQ